MARRILILGAGTGGTLTQPFPKGPAELVAKVAGIAKPCGCI